MKNRKDMLISIIIRTYNEENNIGKLLTLIKQQKLSYNYEIIIVDSGSTDKTVNIAKEFNVKIIKIKPEEFSFGYSLNKGIEESVGSVCVFVSAHCFPTNEKWLEELVTPLLENKRIGLVYGKQRGGDTSKFSEKEIFKKWYPDNVDGIQYHPFSNNANTAIRKNIWEECKYDETLTGLEDLDWAKKILNKGFLIYYNPEAEVLHIHDETWKQIKNRYKREAMAFYEIFPEQKFSFFSFIKYFLLNTMMDLFHSLREGKIKIKEIILYRYNQFKGTYDGAKHKDSITKELKNIFYYPNKRK